MLYSWTLCILLKKNKDTISRKSKKDRHKMLTKKYQKDKHELRNITQFKMNLTKNRDFWKSFLPSLIQSVSTIQIRRLNMKRVHETTRDDSTRQHPWHSRLGCLGWSWQTDGRQMLSDCVQCYILEHYTYYWKKNKDTISRKSKKDRHKMQTEN
jgi:hypothetical protein